MNNYYNHYGNYIPQIESVVRPDMKNYALQLKQTYKNFIAGIVFSFFLFFIFIISIPNISANNDISNSQSIFASFALMFIPFIGLGICGIFTVINYGRYRVANALVAVINQIEEKDKILIKNISYEYSKLESDTLYAIKLLMTNKNLINYEIIDDFIVAKRSLALKSEDIPKSDILKDAVFSAKFCKNCGIALAGDELYCKNCGAKLK